MPAQKKQETLEDGVTQSAAGRRHSIGNKSPMSSGSPSTCFSFPFDRTDPVSPTDTVVAVAAFGDLRCDARP
jgi:hypothetical protein